MQKLVILLSFLVCLAAAGHLGGVERKPWWLQNIMGRQQTMEMKKLEISEVDVRERQKFLLDVLLQVQNPVVNKEIIELGKILINDPAAYWEAQDELLWQFLEQCREHEVLGRHEIYTVTNLEHVRQMVGLTKFLTLAKDWPTFQRNVCFARLHLNPIMFVNALIIAVQEREDTRDLVLPAPHEILPQLFYDKDVILTAENVDWLDLVSKTTTTKPSLMHIIGLGNMWNMMSPIHWIRLGKPLFWHPWQVRQPIWTPIDTGKVVTQMEVDMKEPEKVEIIGGPIVRPLGMNLPVEETKSDDTKVLVESEEKLVIPVEQPHPLSYFTDDVALNTFWNHAMNQRLVETVTMDKQLKTPRWGVEKTLPWEKVWNNKGKWSTLEQKEEWQPLEWMKAGKWAGVGTTEKTWGEKSTKWHPEMTQVEKQQWWNEQQMMTGERMGKKWQAPEEETVQQLIQHERQHRRHIEGQEEMEKKPINWNRLHINRRRQNWQRPSTTWWNKEQNMPVVTEKTQKRWNHRMTEEIEGDNGEEFYPRISGQRWKNIRNGRVVDEEVMPWNKDDSQQTDEWLSRKQWPIRRDWENPEIRKPWGMWEKKNEMPNEEWTKPRGQWMEDTDEKWTKKTNLWNPVERKWQEMRSTVPVGVKETTEEWTMPRTQWQEENDDKWVKKINPWTPVDKKWEDIRSTRPVDLKETTEEWNKPRGQWLEDADEKWNKETNPLTRFEKKWEDIRSTVPSDAMESIHSRPTRSIKTEHISPTQQLMIERSGELFMQNIQQLVARLNLEKITVAQTMETKTMEEQLWHKPELLTTSGKLYQQIMVSPMEAHNKVQHNMLKLKHIIDTVLERTKIHPKNPEVVKVIGEILIEANGEEGNVWDELNKDINAAIYGIEQPINKPTSLSLPSSNLHDPIYIDIISSLNELIWHYKKQLKPYEREQLLVPGIRVNHVEVDELMTYFDVTDGDLINLIDQQLLQTGVNNIEKLQKQLVARQQRLNHKQFTLGYDITAEQPQRVIVRTFLGPKIDEYGRTLTLTEAQQHYVLLDAFVENLIPGVNHVERNSRDIVWTTRDTSSISEIYRRVMQGLPMHELISHNCRFPHRLLLPRGIPNGLPMQLLVVVTPVNEEDRKMYEMIEPEWLCGMGIAAMHLDTLPLDFPLDRTIVKIDDFMQPNMLLKDVWIKHDEHVETPRV